ncbi:uncharacterized protein SPPG_05422 [Spizellomyces punctatus DAOM BR117]|uniref:Exonuclease domain-containing protein n=1 Tax=Spizellomyces punctatus (strain DAOM BR117) TaxID=645134 RepID=A0A0L0HEJ6_SPIPD|nr:uncharacterized protein SPPG_05422 [Spizellomyces punctatus DAOM BR117]KNC99168.1 hypothetical protein SPPG_05422 [Spizellomyces punctatus DAOM BR117]|eukprot:XP_016607208.1 hypothetical protein SPPG_05422 [Spizellomyces punctatus DAOM BR117]
MFQRSLLRFNRALPTRYCYSRPFQPEALHWGMASVAIKDPLVWIDLEMTGLDLAKDRIIEIACIITDGDLNIVAEGPNLVISQPKELMEGMSQWCIEHHGKSGLTSQVLASNTTTQSATSQVLSFIKSHIPTSNIAHLAGNSIHMDKQFLQKEMPDIINHLHYRIVDVSTIKELVRRWLPEVAQNAPRKGLSHRALDDIRESIQELRYYRQAAFKRPVQ